MRGGERVLEALCEMFPEADIFTHVYSPECMSPTIRRHTVKTSFIARLPRAATKYQTYLPLMPLALEQLDLREYELVISSESGPAKGVIVRPDAVHVCYCHSPMRYVWDMYHDYRNAAGMLTKLLMPLVAHYLRIWDVSSSARVDHFIANSAHVAARIRKYYRRESVVIHPPVNVDDFSISNDVGEFYLMLGQLVGYKQPELAVEAFNQSGRPLIVVGDGERYDALKKMAKANVQVMGRQSFDVIRDLCSRCRALVFPGVEDFGIVPLEVMAAGRPVLAYARGGALESVVPGVTGMFFHEQTAHAINQAVREFEANSDHFDPIVIREHAKKFSNAVFKERMREAIDDILP